jgi:hypothetical protein
MELKTIHVKFQILKARSDLVSQVVIFLWIEWQNLQAEPKDKMKKKYLKTLDMLE